MLAAINLSARGLPCGPPNRSSAVCMCRLARIAAIRAMTPPHIVGKMEVLLSHGITTEAQVVYLMAAVRKLLEQRQPDENELVTFDYLKFHCDWTLHSKLDGRMAQKILRLFDAANLELKAGGELHNLPDDLNTQIQFISKMTYFERELTRF